MSAAWCSAALRRIASAITRIAERLDAPSVHADPLPADRDPMRHEERLFELRHRLSRYY